MKSFSFNEPWVNSYVERLLGLSATTKKAIIRLLERSIQEKNEPTPKKEGVDRWMLLGCGKAMVRQRSWPRRSGMLVMIGRRILTGDQVLT